MVDAGLSADGGVRHPARSSSEPRSTGCRAARSPRRNRRGPSRRRRRRRRSRRPGARPPRAPRPRWRRRPRASCRFRGRRSRGRGRAAGARRSQRPDRARGPARRRSRNTRARARAEQLVPRARAVRPEPDRSWVPARETLGSPPTEPRRRSRSPSGALRGGRGDCRARGAAPAPTARRAPSSSGRAPTTSSGTRSRRAWRSRPPRCMQIRSSPSAMPPCGGAP